MTSRPSSSGLPSERTPVQRARLRHLVLLAGAAALVAACEGDPAPSAAADADAAPTDSSGGDAGTGSDTAPAGSGGGGAADVVINEVAPSGEPSDWVELLNIGDAPADLSGWSLTDDDPTHVFTFPTGTALAPGAYLVVERGAVGSFDFGLGPQDAVRLYRGGVQIDAVSWTDGAAPASTSYGRLPNGTGAFTTLVTPTPGAENLGNPPMSCGDGAKDWDEVCDGEDLGGVTCFDVDLGAGELACLGDCSGLILSGCAEPSGLIRVNEATSLDDDRIELFNPGADAVDLTGWSVADEHADQPGGTFLLYPGGAWTIPAGGFLVLTKELDHEFGLGGEDAVRLMDPDGVLVDVVRWPQDGAKPSWCRLPDGGPDVQTCAAATFGASNVGGPPR